MFGCVLCVVKCGYNLLSVIRVILPVDAKAKISGSATANAVKNHSGYSLVLEEVKRPSLVKFPALNKMLRFFMKKG